MFKIIFKLFNILKKKYKTNLSANITHRRHWYSIEYVCMYVDIYIKVFVYLKAGRSKTRLSETIYKALRAQMRPACSLFRYASENFVLITRNILQGLNAIKGSF